MKTGYRKKLIEVGLPLVATLSQLAAAQRLTKGDVTLAQLETKFRVDRLLPEIKGLREDMQAADFANCAVAGARRSTRAVFLR